jgi:hypothetical protein
MIKKKHILRAEVKSYRKAVVLDIANRTIKVVLAVRPNKIIGFLNKKINST